MKFKGQILILKLFTVGAKNRSLFCTLPDKARLVHFE